MSIIFVFVGQCGNQVGAAVAKKLAENCVAGPTYKFSSSSSENKQQPPPLQQPTPYSGPCFGTDGYFRSVLVDCEPKVVDSVVKSCAQQNIHIRPTNCVTGRSGRGNSWSLGYCGLPETDEAEVQGGAFRVSCQTDQLERDRTVLCRALKAIHAETRRCDDGMVEAIVVLHSMAGGTGSGLGCALVENIRHHFCCNGAVHDGDEDDNGEQDDDFRFSHHQQQHQKEKEIEEDSVAQFFMRRDTPPPKRNLSTQNKNKRQRNSNNESSTPPPSILPEDMIREGTYGEPRKARFVLSVCVAPLVQGELAVQSINASLTLRTVIKNCDAVVLLRNDCQKIFSSASSSSIGRVSARGGGGNSSSSSFEVINNFFASLLVSALQGGNSYGCVAELLEASVLRVAGDHLDWERNDDDDVEENYNSDDENQEHYESSTSSFKNNNNTTKQPPFGPRVLTLLPWDPRSGWAAGFRHSSVTATLIKNNSSSSTTANQHDPQLLQAYLCNEVKDLAEDLCTIIDRDGEMKKLMMKQNSSERKPSSTVRSGSNTKKKQNQNDETSLTKQDKLVLDIVQRKQQQQMLTSSGGSNNNNSRSSVLVLNQSSELTTSILSFFFKDAAAKVDTGAYMHTFNTRGILEQVFSATKNRTNNNINKNKFRATSAKNRFQQPTTARKFSPRRSRQSEEHNMEFARQFVNSALVDLLEYVTEAYPGM